MIVRKMRIDDMDAVMRLYHSLTKRYRNNPDALKLAMKHPATEVYVIEENFKILGTATLSHRADPMDGLIGYVAAVVVDPKYRGKGFGKELNMHLIEAARQKECEAMELTSKPKRIRANRLYKKLGFVKKDTNFYVLKL